MKPRLKKLVKMQKMMVRCKERHANDKRHWASKQLGPICIVLPSDDPVYMTYADSVYHELAYLLSGY